MGIIQKLIDYIANRIQKPWRSPFLVKEDEPVRFNPSTLGYNSALESNQLWKSFDEQLKG